MSKRVISIIAILALLITMIIIPTTVVSAASGEIVETEGNSDAYGLASKCQDGNILHAFDWKAKEITEHAQEIAEAGYTSVQITPMQTTKQTINAGAFATDWWCFYQPIKIGVGNALGSEADIEEMCNTCHQYGIKVIADVVFNHSMGIVAKSKAESSEIKKQLDSELFNYYRNTPSSSQTHGANDESRAWQVTGDLNKELPDFNTSKTEYQNAIINKVLNKYLDLGVDGFRFDAAKHIETPDDGANASQFWPNITNAIKSKKSDTYMYGELLSSAGKFNPSSYTKYINVTDYAYGATVRSALSSNSASSLINYGTTGTSKNQNVLWVESHDNFCDYTSTSLKQNKQIVGWAAIAARKDAPALYFVRPTHEALDSAGYIKYDDYMGYQGASTTWKSTAVAEVNKFKNAFVGQNETVTANGSMLFVQRGTTGMVISNLSASGASVSQSCTMANGTYKDQVSGSQFTVSNGTIKGTIGNTGVAVIYNKQKNVPKLTVKLNSTQINPNTTTPDPENRYTDSTATITISGTNVKTLKIKVGNLAEKTYNKTSTTIKLNSGIQAGKSVPVVVTATSNDNVTITNTYTVHKKNANEAKVVYFDNTATNWFQNNNSAAITGTTHIWCYQKTGSGSNAGIYSFPGKEMSLVSGKLYKITVASNCTYVKFSEGQIPSTANHLGHTFAQCGGYCGRTMPQTVVLYGTAVNSANRQNGGYQLVGSMICKDLKWYDYGDYPAASLSSSDVTFEGEDPTETTTPTTPTEPKPTTTELILGDADLDGDVSVVDAVLIQKWCAALKTLSDDAIKCGDVDCEGLTVLDASYIQKWCASLPQPYDIGKPIKDQPTTEPTQPTTAPTTAPSGTSVEVNLNGCFSGANTIYLYAEGSGDYPGTPMTKSGSTYVGDLDTTLYNQYRVVGEYNDGSTVQSYAIDASDQVETLETYTIKSQVNFSVAYCHMWSNDGSGATTIWPGIKMSGSSGNYSLVIPNNAPYDQYKFTQSASGPESSEYYFPWSQPENITLYCDFGYNPPVACAHYWVTGGGGTTWPGAQMTHVSGTIYKIEIPTQYDNIIFNNNNGGDQTDNLTVPGNNYIYYKNTKTWKEYN